MCTLRLRCTSQALWLRAASESMGADQVPAAVPSPRSGCRLPSPPPIRAPRRCSLMDQLEEGALRPPHRANEQASTGRRGAAGPRPSRPAATVKYQNRIDEPPPDAVCSSDDAEGRRLRPGREAVAGINHRDHARLDRGRFRLLARVFQLELLRGDRFYRMFCAGSRNSASTNSSTCITIDRPAGTAYQGHFVELEPTVEALQRRAVHRRRWNMAMSAAVSI